MEQIIYNPGAGTNLDNAIVKAKDVQDNISIKTTLNFNGFLVPVDSHEKMRADYFKQIENERKEDI